MSSYSKLDLIFNYIIIPFSMVVTFVRSGCQYFPPLPGIIPGHGTGPTSTPESTAEPELTTEPEATSEPELTTEPERYFLV
jgi:hypothetical protein